MELFNVQRLSDCLRRLGVFAVQCAEAKRDDGTMVYADTYADNLRSAVDDLVKVCAENGFTDTAAEIHDAATGIEYDLNVAALLEIIKRIDDSVSRKLRGFKVISVQNDRAEYVDNQALFADLKTAFPSAIADLTDAANCLAVECPTACVFHAMRAAEIGLRSLAWDRRVQIPKKRPIELATWEAIIKELEKSETEIISYPVTLAREAQLDFYHGALMEFRAFKNKFRNPAMHSRDRYDRDEAKSALTHVVDFLRVLSSRIGEKNRTPKVWGRNEIEPPSKGAIS